MRHASLHLHHPRRSLGPNNTEAWGINDSGQIVGSYRNASGIHGFLYSNGTYHPRRSLGHRRTVALGINDSGQIVGEYVDASSTHGFLRNPISGIYTTLDDPLATGSVATASTMRARSSGFTSASAPTASCTTPTAPPYSRRSLGRNSTFARGINAAGQIVGFTRHRQNATASSPPSAAAPTPTPPSTIPWPPAAPLHSASTMRARSSALRTNSGARLPL